MSANRAHLLAVDIAPPAESQFSGVPDNAPEQRADKPVAGGIDDSFIAVYEAHYPRLVRALELGGTSPEYAEDVAQEAFARTFGHWRRVRRGTNPAGYAYRVAFRIVRRKRQPDLALGDDPASPDVADEATLAVGIERALQAMPAAQRRCAVLCLAVGMPTKEAARTLGIAESTVRKQIERARSDLRLALDVPS
jgi:RNA polymerase sigma-70 factor (ECF subfamily)